ncbi:carbohydrate ABC transporter permease [Cohnella hashimotonis]|uniref:Sugar ABC transporter permease n=1 Tax=Cohnella hashimotonis TaxID=2826895 RepID=A0ABT6TPT1_9BACL|nr:sugar ABC transporter permease [Cohnella hashimotonis]MDI4648857.1 sugar ABC transporter permease [Cohnella hashimotonis]
MNKNNLTGFVFASPWIIGFLAFTLYPLCASLYYGFTDFNVFQSPRFVGLDNYRDLMGDDLFWKSIRNTLYLTVISTPVNLLFALLTAMLLNTRIRGLSVYRTVYYIPTIIPLAATSLLWMWIMNGQYGLLNKLLGWLGLPQPGWFSDPAYSKMSLILMGLWGVGNIIIIFLASLQEVPQSLYESASIDGAGGFRKFRHITIHWISPIILFQLIMQVINNLQYFTQAYFVISSSNLNQVSGGPENSLLMYAVYLYQNAFIYFKMGKASAMAWILFVMAGILTWIIFKSSKRWVTYGGGD